MNDLMTDRRVAPGAADGSAAEAERTAEVQVTADVRRLLAPLARGPKPTLARAQAEAVWARIAAAQPRPRAAWTVWWPRVAFGLASLGGAWWILGRSPPPPAARPTVATALLSAEASQRTSGTMVGARLHGRRALAAQGMVAGDARVEVDGVAWLLEDTSEHTRIELRAGHLTADVPPRAGRPVFEVQTALAQVRVHGTRFAVTVGDVGARAQRAPDVDAHRIALAAGAASQLLGPEVDFTWKARGSAPVGVASAPPQPLVVPPTGAPPTGAPPTGTPPTNRRTLGSTPPADAAPPGPDPLAAAAPVQISVGSGVVEVIPSDGRPPRLLRAGEVVTLEPVTLEGAERAAGRGDLDDALAILLQLGPAESLAGRNRRLRLAQRFDALQAPRAAELWTHLAAQHPEGVHAETFLFHAGLAAHRAGRAALARAHAARLGLRFPHSARLAESQRW